MRIICRVSPNQDKNIKLFFQVLFLVLHVNLAHCYVFGFRIWSSCNLHNYICNNVLGFGLLATCIITFITMFLPKSRQMTAMGREGVFIEVIRIMYLVSCILCILYSVYPISIISYILYNLYPVYPIFCISYINYILYPV